MRYTIIFNPAYAKNLNREGYNKEKIKKYLADHRLIPAMQVRPQTETPLLPAPLEKGTANLVQLIRDPRFIRIIVGGGPGAFVAHLVGGGATPGMKEIQKIELPKNWDKLVAKYKNLVPVYARY